MGFLAILRLDDRWHPCSAVSLLPVGCEAAVGAGFILVGAEAGEAEFGAVPGEEGLEIVENGVARVSLEFQGHDEASGPLVEDPVFEEIDGALRGGDDITNKPIHGSVRTEREGIALVEAEPRVAHEIVAERGTIDGGDVGTTVEGDITPATGAGAQIDAGLAGADGDSEALFGFEEFGEGAAWGGFIRGDGDEAGREGRDQGSKLVGDGWSEDGEPSGAGVGEQDLDDR